MGILYVHHFTDGDVSLGPLFCNRFFFLLVFLYCRVGSVGGPVDFGYFDPVYCIGYTYIFSFFTGMSVPYQKLRGFGYMANPHFYIIGHFLKLRTFLDFILHKTKMVSADLVMY